MKKLQIYITPSYSSVAVNNGINREVSGPNAADVIAGMDASDRAILVAFCHAVVASDASGRTLDTGGVL